MIERAAYSEALFEEQERAQITLNSIGDAVVSTDVSGRITYLNPSAEDLTGWSRYRSDRSSASRISSSSSMQRRAIQFKIP